MTGPFIGITLLPPETSSNSEVVNWSLENKEKDGFWLLRRKKGHVIYHCCHLETNVDLKLCERVCALQLLTYLVDL